MTVDKTNKIQFVGTWQQQLDCLYKSSRLAWWCSIQPSLYHNQQHHICETRSPLF